MVIYEIKHRGHRPAQNREFAEISIQTHALQAKQRSLFDSLIPGNSAVNPCNSASKTENKKGFNHN